MNNKNSLIFYFVFYKNKGVYAPNYAAISYGNYFAESTLIDVFL